jgi:hypothetical protein
MDPAFPDLVGQWADEEARKTAKPPSANDNEEFFELLRSLLARIGLDATRTW